MRGLIYPFVGYNNLALKGLALKKTLSLVCLLILMVGHDFSSFSMSYKIRKHNLKPLTGSLFSKENPGVVPYEKCSIAGADDVDFETVETSFLAGVEKTISLLSLFCYSKHLRTAIKIPVGIHNSHFVGLGFSFSKKHNHLRLRRLDGLLFDQVIGKYRGFSGGLTFGGGALLRKKGSKAFITLSSIYYDTPLTAKLGYQGLKLFERKINRLEIYTEEYIFQMDRIKALLKDGVIDQEEAALRARQLNLWLPRAKYKKSYQYQVDHFLNEWNTNSAAVQTVKGLKFKKITQDEAKKYVDRNAYTAR